MKPRWVVLLSGGGGLLFCVGAVTLADQLGVGPHFGAVAGEDDFSLRVSVFLLGVVPTFIAIGAWIGLRSGSRIKAHVAALLGVVAAALGTFGAAPWITSLAAHLHSRQALNAAAIGYMLGWVATSFVSALAARSLSR